MKKFLRVILYISMSILALWVIDMRWYNIGDVSSPWEGYNFGYIFLGLNGISPDDFETMNAMFSYLLYWNIDLLKSHCTDCPEHSYPRYFIDGTPNRGG